MSLSSLLPVLCLLLITFPLGMLLVLLPTAAPAHICLSLCMPCLVAAAAGADPGLMCCDVPCRADVGVQWVPCDPPVVLPPLPTSLQMKPEFSL